MRTPAFTGQFRRDIRLAEKRGKDISKLRDIMELLIQELPLGLALLDHPLKGDWKGWRDLHIEPDWLLIYKVNSNEVRFERTGAHADLFK